jgi:acetyl-CoA carboxylase biotin carboxyl carrier protein
MSDLTYQDVLSILRLIDSAPASDFELQYEGTRIKVSRAHEGTTSLAPAARAPVAAPVPAAAKPSPSAAPAAAHGLSAAAAKPQPAPAHKAPANIPNAVEVRPPMAGTFYAAPSPGAPPFVEQNRKVKKGDQLGIVEVMKLFTAVLSPCDGTVRAILVGNEQFVESDHTIMIIEAVK